MTNFISLQAFEYAARQRAFLLAYPWTRTEPWAFGHEPELAWSSKPTMKIDPTMPRCYDCGSTIPHHHTPMCDLAELTAIRDLPAEPGTQWWTLRHIGSGLPDSELLLLDGDID